MIMNLYKSILVTLSCAICLSATAQRTVNSSNVDQTKKRTTTAQILVELDKTAKANNRNNGRSNKDNCCNDGIVAPAGYEVIAFGLSTQWYIWEEGVGNQDIPNPIPYLKSIASSWEVGLYDGDGVYLIDKSSYISDNELLLSIATLDNGKYYIEIEHDGSFFHTGFEIGGGTKLPVRSRTQN